MDDLFDQIEEADLSVEAKGFTETLYKKDTKEGVRMWTITVTDLGNKASIKISSGLETGGQVEHETFVSKGKNAGRANATTYMQQALSDARSKVKKQQKDSYVHDRDNLLDSNVLGSGSMECMTAKVYDPLKKQSNSKDLAGWKLVGKRIGVQRKFDGVRRITYISMAGVQMYSRGGDLIATLPHIEEQLLDSFLKLVKVVPELAETGIWVDGEAYSHDISFSMINGITRKGATTPEQHAARLHISYYLYDLVSDLGYEDRAKILQHFASEHVKMVETIYIDGDAKRLEELFVQFIEEGYEGAMIRLLDQPYKHGRSTGLLKYKAFEDAEFIIVGAKESAVDGRIGSFTIRMDMLGYDRSGKLIETFEGTPICSTKDKEYAWEHRDDYLGKKVTVNFFGRQESNVPRFPRVKGLRYATDM